MVHLPPEQSSSDKLDLPHALVRKALVEAIAPPPGKPMKQFKETTRKEEKRVRSKRGEVLATHTLSFVVGQRKEKRKVAAVRSQPRKRTRSQLKQEAPPHARNIYDVPRHGTWPF